MAKRRTRPLTPSSQDLLTGMAEWRQQHPNATLREIELELDARLARLRARMLEDLALESAATQWQDRPPPCPHCGGPLEDRGTKPRTIQTHGGQDLILERAYGWCPTCQVGVFPPG